MGTIFNLLMVVIIIASVLLTIIIMAQNPKGGGLSSTFGGSSAGVSFGVQRTNDFMEKATWGLGIFITALIVLSAVLTAKPSTKATQQLPAQQQQQAPVSQPQSTASPAPLNPNGNN